jgi:23S rRNA (adenine2503-C2)-methyltransferase
MNPIHKHDAGGPPVNLYGLSVEEIVALPCLQGEPAFRAGQIARWMYNRGIVSFDQMSDISKELRARIASACVIGRIQPSFATEAGDGSATKYLFKLPPPGGPEFSGADRSPERSVEAVWIRDDRRDTLCISSQAGCAYGCTFCATAAMKAGRNLTTGEILSQVAALREAMASRGPIDVHNIVFMGMGEPLANYDAVVGALKLLCGEPGFGLAARRITVSTVGLIPEIRRLAAEPVGVRLAFSLNATTDDVRSRIMPVNRKYPFYDVFRALREYQHAKQAPATLEYVLLKGVNDTREDARRLAEYARSLQCKVNLIAYNPHPYAPFVPVPDRAIEEFRRWMMPIAMTTVTVRWSKGRDIQAACGQLSTANQGAGGISAPGAE